MAYNRREAIQAAKEEKKKMREKIREAIESWSANPETLVEFFQFAERFSYKYSFRNTLLIQQQNRGAILCQSSQAWKKSGYSILDGMNGMSIYVRVQATMLEIDGKYIPLSEASDKQREDYKNGKIPYKTMLHYRVGKTYDIAQTNFPPEKYPELLSRGIPSEKHEKCIQAICEYCETELQVPVIMEAKESGDSHDLNMEYGIQGASLYGFYSRVHNDIHIGKTLQDTAALSTLTHEMGHVVAHQNREENENIHKIEFEADAFSIMLQEHFGLPISAERKEHISEHYRQYQKTAGENFKPEESVDRIFALYKKHINGIEQKLQKYLPEENRDFEKDMPAVRKENKHEQMEKKSSEERKKKKRKKVM